MRGSDFTHEIVELVFEGEIQAALDVLSKYSDQAVFDQFRVTQAQKLIDDVRTILNKEYVGAEKIILRDFEDSCEIRLTNTDDILSNPPGNYVFGERIGKRSTFEADFINLDSITKKVLVNAGFDIDIASSNVDSIRVFHNAILCAEDRNLLTCSTIDGFFDRMASARLAKATRVNFRRKPSEFIEKAIIIPPPHHPNNYYHVVTESAYNLRFAKGNDNLIIHPEDIFGVIGFVADRLGVSRSRLISYEQAKNAFVYKVAMPKPVGFFWSRDIYKFFSRIVEPINGERKIYISRSLRGRGPDNEVEVEALLRREGFDIIHAELLSISEQASMFSSARYIVAPHGAGLTNLLYTRPGTKLIELFRSEFISRDFYLRSTNNDIVYRPLIFDRSIDLDALKEALVWMEGG